MKLKNLGAGDSVGFINDIHISNEKLQAFRDNWKEGADVLFQRGITDQVVGGDLFESRHAQSLMVLRTVQECLEYSASKGINVFLANGNHDKVNQEDEFGYCHIFKYNPNVTVIDSWAYFESEEANIFIMAYFPEQGSLSKRLKEITSSLTFNNGKKNILYGHAGVMGALTKDNPDKEIAKEAFDVFDKIYMGHYHCPVKTGKVEYIGASRQYNYGENTIKGYNICTPDGELEFVQNKVNDRMITIDVDFKDIDTIKDIILSERDKNKDTSGRLLVKARIKSTKTQSALINKEKLREDGVDKVEVVNIVEKSATVKSNFYQKYNREQIKETYSDFCKERNKDVNLGLKYLK